jgi:hypothetical protein
VLAPGQFQTEEYALELFLEAGMSPEEAAEHVRLRLQRQEILDGPNATRVTAMIDESVLYRVVGSPAVLLGQLNHLMELSKRPNVIIQVVCSPKYYHGQDVPFEIATGRAITATLCNGGRRRPDHGHPLRGRQGGRLVRPNPGSRPQRGGLASRDHGGHREMPEPAVIPGWRKSSYSGNGGTSCVEAAHVPGAILVRDTQQHGHGPVLRLTPQAWHHFTATLRAPAR